MEDADIFVHNEEVLVSITPFPFGIYKTSKSDILYSTEGTMAQLLARLQSFYQLIKRARSKIGIKDVFVFPERTQLKDAVELKYKHLDYSQRQILDGEVEKILRRYGLGINWKISIEAVILTHTLPIPYPAYPISVHLPLKRDDTGRKVLKSALESAIAVVRQNEVLKYPAIYFTARFTSNKLIDWIKHNIKEIEVMNSILPDIKEVGSKMVQRTERLGALVFILKKDGINSWTQMVKIVDSMSKKFKMDDYWEGHSPTPEDLRLAYESYKKLLHKLDVFSSESK